MRTLAAVLAAILVFCLCYIDAAEPHNGNLLDAIELLQGRVPCGQGDCPCCPEVGDVNGDGQINELDGIYLLQSLFNHALLPADSVTSVDLFLLSKSKTIVFPALLTS